MARKKTTKRRIQNNGRTVRGRPFEKGHKFGFRPGQSGNPGGRPKTRLMSEASRAWFARASEDDPERTNAEVLVEKLGALALGGDLAAARELSDRAEGRPRQAIDINEDERERKTKMYGRMVERVLERMLTEHGQVITHEQAIDTLAAYQPEIREYIND